MLASTTCMVESGDEHRLPKSQIWRAVESWKMLYAVNYGNVS